MLPIVEDRFTVVNLLVTINYPPGFPDEEDRDVLPIADIWRFANKKEIVKISLPMIIVDITAADDSREIYYSG